MAKEIRVEVVHGMVGKYPRGSILKASVFGTELPRLLELGAVRESDSDRDWDASMSHQTLHEAIHSGSPPTLPNVPYIDATPDEVRARMGGDTTGATIITAQTQGYTPGPDEAETEEPQPEAPHRHSFETAGAKDTR